MKKEYVLILSMLVLLWGCKNEPGTDSREASSIVISQILSDPPTLHPINGAYQVKGRILYYVHQRLTRLDLATGERMPALAKALPTLSEDGLTLEYEIHPDAAWEDGTPIVAEDVVFSAKAAKSPLNVSQAGAALYSLLKDVVPDPDNPKKFSLVMNEKNVFSPYLTNELYILDKRVYDPEGLLDNFSFTQFADTSSSFREHPDMVSWANFFNDDKFGRDLKYLSSGSGPYKVVDWIPGQQVVIEKRPNYWGANIQSPSHSQKADKIIFKVVNDEKSLELQIKQEAIDVSMGISTQTYRALKKSDKATANYDIGYRTKESSAYILINTRPDGSRSNLALRDQAVRRALSLLVPVDEIIERYYDGMAKRVVSPVNPASSDYNNNLPLVPFSIDSAKAVLAADGWKDLDGDLILDKVIDGQQVSLKLSLTILNNRETITNMATLIKQQMAKAGIEIAVNPLELSRLVSEVRNHNYELVMLATTNSSLPYDFSQLWHSSTWITGENMTGFGTPESDRLVLAAPLNLDPVSRKQQVDRIQEIIFEEVPAIFLFSNTMKYVIHKRYGKREVSSISPFVLMNDLEPQKVAQK
ncbi:MAG: peptide ABC transporter substrate-binding protein [Bacteroidota bacterium]